MNFFLKQYQWSDFVPFFLAATLFFIPISSSIKGIFWTLSIISILLTPAYRQDFPFLFKQSVIKTAMIFFGIVILGCFWSAASYSTSLIFIDKYCKLLYLPILALGFRSKKVRLLGIHAFILAMLVTCIVSFLQFVPIFKVAHPKDAIFNNHIITSYMMALAAYFSAIFLFQNKDSKRIIYGVLFCIFGYYMIFINTGRAGYIIYFALSILALIQYLEAKQIAAGILCFCSVFAIFSYQSPVVSQGISSVFTEIQKYQQGEKLTSVGFRVTFHQFAKSLFLSSPWIGQGTGGFSYAFQKENKIPQWYNLLDPHSQYWLVASELGLLGLTALFAFFASIWVTALRLHDMKPILLGTLVALLLGNLSDSLLFYAAGGQLFIIMSALCLGELVENQERVMDEDPVFLEGKAI